jgi:DNA-binding MarR family transcriptional regulator
MNAEPGDGAQWDEDNAGSLLFDLWLIQQMAYPLIETAISPTGLSAEEYGFYLLLSHVKDATPGDLARMTGMRTNTTSAAITRLEKRGHIIRTPNAKDGRSVLIRLSPEGNAVLEKALTLNSGFHERLSAELAGTNVRQSVFELERSIRKLANMPPRPDAAGGA